MNNVSNPGVIEWLKLGASVATPLTLFLLGLLAKRYADQAEERQARSEVAAEWRLEVFRTLLPIMNKLYCYFTYQGDWRKISPLEAVSAKRECDRIFHMNKFLWNKETVGAYQEFIEASFRESRGPGHEFVFRANVDRHRENPDWRDDWEQYFVQSDQRIRRKDFVLKYENFLTRAVKDLGILPRA